MLQKEKFLSSYEISGKIDVTTHTHRHCREGGNLINISVKGGN